MVNENSNRRRAESSAMDHRSAAGDPKRPLLQRSLWAGAFMSSLRPGSKASVLCSGQRISPMDSKIGFAQLRHEDRSNNICRLIVRRWEFASAPHPNIARRSDMCGHAPASCSNASSARRLSRSRPTVAMASFMPSRQKLTAQSRATGSPSISSRSHCSAWPT